MKKLLVAVFTFFSLIGFAQDSLECRLLDHLPYSVDLNDVWAYVDADGREYALVGKTNGFSVVDLDSSVGLVELISIPGPQSIWRDIKTWGHYAYVVHDIVSAMGNGVGLLIVDLDSLTNAHYKTMYPQVTLWNGSNQLLTRAHNIYIDENGILYLFGSNVGVGGAVMMDVASDPWNPVVVGSYDGSYFHDGYARNDTLYGAALQNGIEILDVSFKLNPQFVNTFQTPNSFAHNCWLSDNGKTLFTTDEVPGGFIGIYDVSDPLNVSELMRHRVTVPSKQIIPHNAHAMGNFVITSYYTFGLHILDAKYPEYSVLSSYYDTSPLSGNTYNGAWGAYPYLPSGRILITDIDEGLFVLESNYTEVARMKGIVIDSLTHLPIPTAQVYLTSGIHSEINTATANFKASRLSTGWDTLVVTKSGYFPWSQAVYLDVDSFPSVTVKLIPLDISVDEHFSTFGFECFPNPGASRVNVRLNRPSAPGAQVKLLDVQGRVVYERSLDEGTISFFMEASYLARGIYTVEIANSNAVIRQKWIKQ